MCIRDRSLVLCVVCSSCCGTTPAHIRAIADACEGVRPREIQPQCQIMRLSGLEPLLINKTINFVNIGERCNVRADRQPHVQRKAKHDRGRVR